MLEVSIPGNFTEERKYIIATLLNGFLGIPHTTGIHGDPEKTIISFGNHRLIISDKFWSRCDAGKGYLRQESIPSKVEYVKNSFTSEPDLPVIYGTGLIRQTNHEITCDIDIFASSFFLLSRWEEYVLPFRDEHSRFPGERSLAHTHGFLTRPVVNEYVEMLWKMLTALGYSYPRKTRRFHIKPTHDIDEIRFWNFKRFRSLPGNIAGDLLKRKSARLAFKRMTGFIATLLNPRRDPDNYFEQFMDLAEKTGTRADFNFIAGGTSPYDPGYPLNDRFCQLLFDTIIKRGHTIGIHPSYHSFRHRQRLEAELELLRALSHAPVESSRQHYLRFEVPATWQMLEQTGIKTDSTLYYPGFPGFRCGTCYEYPVFDVIRKKELDLTEQPLLLMDRCLLNKTTDEVSFTVKNLVEKTRKYEGTFVFLWHNRNFHWPGKNSIESLFKKELYGF